LEDRRSAIWGGATLGLVVGLILGFFVGSYWTTVLYAVLIGAACGVAANVLAWPADIVHRRDVKRREHAARAASESLLETSEDFRTVPEYLFETSEDYRTQAKSLLETSEELLRNISPADFETPDVEDGVYEMVYMVEDGRERTVVKFEPGDLDPDQQGFESVSDEAEYMLLESDLNREMWDELSDSVALELRQRKGTKMLYVVEVSEDGKTVLTRASDGTYGAQMGKPIR
jgi:uncharacterized membrane-anchored protein YhcB (DUF1043 family)